jgi:class 3 adenylate cyclase/tetratricopeptide (TPR) repeat protein
MAAPRDCGHGPLVAGLRENVAVPTCPACASANPEGFRFCGQCGAPLAVTTCGSCGAGNPTDQRFCGQCGSALEGVTATAVATPSLEERKLATVLFADVVGFTSLAERTDPEVVARMVDTAFRRMGEVVAEHGGTVDKYMGDSVMAVFGVPAAHDDDAERAVAAGLAMRELGGDLAFSIGINSGELMVTAVGRAGDLTVIGDTVNVAARLEKAAGPGEVLCGGLTTELAGRSVVFRERPPLPLKGKREPVAVWEAVALRSLREAAPDGPLLIGRGEEIAFLEAQWRRVCRDRQAHIVVLCGEAGSGKTRLLEELARVAEPDGMVVRTRYPAYGSLGGPAVASDVISQLGPIEDPEVSARVGSIAGEAHASLQSIDPAGMPQEQLWALGKLLSDKTADQPLLIIVDDMHRSGDRTLQLLAELEGRLHHVPLLVLLAGRTDPGDWLAKFPAATKVRLNPLSRADAAALADAFACDKPLTREAADFLVERSSGNPLYLRELVTMARARGALVDDGQAYRLTGEAAIPATLQALLAGRLDALEPSQKLVLQHAAVLGEAVTAAQLEVLGSPQPSTVLRSLVDCGLLRDAGEGSFEIIDSLLREVAYETLPRNLRGELHRVAARAGTGVEHRARHLDRAAEYLPDDEALAAEAADALVVAGDALIEASRHLDAMRLLERAVALGNRAPSVLLELGRLQALCGKAEEALATLDMVPDDPADPAVAVERDHAAANTRTFLDPEWALPRLHDAAARWHTLGRTDKEAWAYANAGVALFYRSRMEDAATELERALELFEEAGDRTGAVAASSFLCLARPTDRRVPRWLAGALEFADEAGDRTRQITTLSTLAWHHFFRSFCGGPEDMAAGEGFALRLAELAEELGANDMAMHGWSLLTIMARLSGRLDQALEHAAALERVSVGSHAGDAWLGWAASFSAAVASGAAGAAPPFPPQGSTDPVVSMAGLVIEAELTLAGRLPEALDRLEHSERPGLGVISDLGSVVYALALVLSGRGQEARPWVERAAGAALALNATATAKAARALWAEITGDLSDLPPAPGTVDSFAGALVLRARAAHGDAAASEVLGRASRALAMPGLVLAL